jgi:hypothetical protein
MMALLSFYGGRNCSMQRYGIGNKAVINDARFAVFNFDLKGKPSGKMCGIEVILLKYSGH